MIKVDKEHISMFMLAEAYSEKHKTEEKIRFFKNNYQKELHEFEKYLTEINESFDLYDDYMEWKAYENYLIDLNKKIQELQSGNIQVA